MERRALLTGLAAVGAATLLGCGSDDATPVPTAPPPTRPTPTTATTTPSARTPTITSTIATGLNVPWGIVFLANGDALVSQRDEGTIVRITPTGKVTTIGEVDGVVGSSGLGEGGLLGIALAPDDESTLFAYITTASDNRLVTMSLSGSRLGSPKTILPGIPTSLHHHGGRLLFDPLGRLYVSVGDAEQRELAQDKGSLAGKILRVTQDCNAAAGNPYGNRTWTYGHRNVEGLAFDAAGRLWATEFGDKAADELNLIRKGGNYGWPQVEGTSDDPDLVGPLVTWPTDACSPAGLAITKSTAYLGALQGECLFEVPLDGTTAGKPVAHFSGDHGRIRHAAVDPDGALWVTTSNTDGRTRAATDDDRIFRVAV